MTRTVLGKTDDIEPGGARSFAAPGTRVFVMRKGDAFAAYRDFCPHAAGTLAYRSGKVVCRRHGASFDAASGDAQSAPAIGMNLEPLDVRVEDDALVLYQEEKRSPWTGQF